MIPLYPKRYVVIPTHVEVVSNVKKFVRNYIHTNAENKRMNDAAMTGYYEHLVTESQTTKMVQVFLVAAAQRAVVVQSPQAVMNSNDEIRDDESKNPQCTCNIRISRTNW